MNIAVPPNLFVMLSYIAGPLSFNFFQLTNFAPWLFRLNASAEYDEISDKFTQFGFSNSLAALNLQDTIVYLAIFLVMAPIAFLLSIIPFLHKFSFTR